MTVAIDKSVGSEDDQDNSSLQILPPPVHFDEFVAWYPENALCRYELRQGV
jgi:hypothetical protein